MIFSQEDILAINYDKPLNSNTLIFRLDQLMNKIDNYDVISKVLSQFPKLTKKVKIIFRILDKQCTDDFLDYLLKFNFEEKILFGITIVISDIGFSINNYKEKLTKLKVQVHIQSDSKFLKYYDNFDINDLYKNKLTIVLNEIDKLEYQKFITRYTYQNGINVKPIDDHMSSFDTLDKSLYSLPKFKVLVKNNISYETETLLIKESKGFNNYGYLTNCNRRLTVFFDKQEPYIRIGSCCCNEINTYELNSFIQNSNNHKLIAFLNAKLIHCKNKNAVMKHVIYDNTCFKNSNQLENTDIDTYYLNDIGLIKYGK